MNSDPGVSQTQTFDPQTWWEMSPYSTPRTIPMRWEVSAFRQEGERGKNQKREEEDRRHSDTGELT